MTSKPNDDACQPARRAARPRRPRAGRAAATWRAERLTEIQRVACSAASVAPRAAGVLEHPRADRDDQPRLLGDRDELRRADRAAADAPPAQQRLVGRPSRRRRATRSAGTPGRARAARGRARGRSRSAEASRTTRRACLDRRDLRRRRRCGLARVGMPASAWPTSASGSMERSCGRRRCRRSRGEGPRVPPRVDRLLHRGRQRAIRGRALIAHQRRPRRRRRLVAAEPGNGFGTPPGGREPADQLPQPLVTGSVAEDVGDALKISRSTNSTARARVRST